MDPLLLQALVWFTAYNKIQVKNKSCANQANLMLLLLALSTRGRRYRRRPVMPPLSADTLYNTKAAH